MLGIGGTELLIIALFGFLIFGPDKLPQVGRTFGRAMRQFKHAQEEMNRVIREEVYDPDKDGEVLGDFKNIFKDFDDDVSKKEGQSKPKAYSGGIDTESGPRAHKDSSPSHVHAPAQLDVDANASIPDGQRGASEASLAAEKPCVPASQSMQLQDDTLLKREVEGESFAQKKARLARERAEKEQAIDKLYQSKREER